MLPSTIKLRILVLLLLALGVTAGPRLAAAASRSSGSPSVQRARRHFLVGRQAFDDKDYATALREFEAGYAIEPRAGFLLNMGHAARRLGERARARALYVEFLATSPPEGERRVAVKLIADLDRELPAASGSPAGGLSPSASAPPRPPAATPAVDLSLTSASTSGSTSTSTSGSASLSLVDVAATADAPSSEPASASPPIYRRWWFWAGAGVVAAGVATAILIGATGAESSVHDNGSWGRINL